MFQALPSKTIISLDILHSFKFEPGCSIITLVMWPRGLQEAIFLPQYRAVLILTVIFEPLSQIKK
jgi:hypothetical protein